MRRRSDQSRLTSQHPQVLSARSGTPLKTPKKRKVIRADELAIPKIITSQVFDEICGIFHISYTQRVNVKARLDAIVIEFADWMTRERREPGRSSDLELLQEVFEHVSAAAAILNACVEPSVPSRLGPSGRLAFKAIEEIVAPMLAAKWMSDEFLNDDFAPRRTPFPREGRQPLRPPPRGSEYFIEEVSLQARREFVSRRPVETGVAVLKTLGGGLDRVITVLKKQPGSRGGRKPIIYRHFLIINLAELWADLGKEVSTGLKSDFAAFCEDVATSIGWPDHGVVAAIPDARDAWLHLRPKSSQ
jgi:hypothetical protein